MASTAKKHGSSVDILVRAPKQDPNFAEEKLKEKTQGLRLRLLNDGIPLRFAINEIWWLLFYAKPVRKTEPQKRGQAFDPQVECLRREQFGGARWIS